jgi:ubiquinone/menaquinone biosynthesis C-methylase UbiE
LKFNVSSEIRRDYFRSKLLRFTRKAFKTIPELTDPVILDVGCGTGVVTLELARLSGGRVVGIDIDQAALDSLKDKIVQAGLAAQIKTVNCPMQDMKFNDASFDIIWCEGAVFVIGFEEALKEWRRFIKPQGFSVLHARMIDLEKRIALIPSAGYHLLETFSVPKESWWDDYYSPMENLVDGLRHRYQNEPDALALLSSVQREIDDFKNKPEYQSSVFYVMQRSEEDKSEDLPEGTVVQH